MQLILVSRGWRQITLYHRSINQPATENTKLPRHHDIGTELNSQIELNGDKNVEPEPLSIRWPPSGGLSYYVPVIAGDRNFQRPILCLTKRAKSVKLKIGQWKKKTQLKIQRSDRSMYFFFLKLCCTRKGGEKQRSTIKNNVPVKGVFALGKK